MPKNKHEPRDFVDKLIEASREAKETIQAAHVARRDLLQAVKEAKAAIREAHDEAQERINERLTSDAGLTFFNLLQQSHEEWNRIIRETEAHQKTVAHLVVSTRAELTETAEYAGRESARLIEEMAKVAAAIPNMMQQTVDGIVKAMVENAVEALAEETIVRVLTESITVDQPIHVRLPRS